MLLALGSIVSPVFAASESESHKDFFPDFPNVNYSPDNKGAIEIGSKMLYIEDSLRQYNIGSILANEHRWKKIDKPSPNFGFTSSAFWFRFNLTNSDSSPQKIFIELPIPFLDDVQLYQVDGVDVLDKHRVGDAYPFPQRPVKHQNFVMPFELSPGENQFLMRVAAAGTVEAPLFVWSPDEFLVANSDGRLIQGIWIGLIAIMVVYNFFLYISLRDISYLYFVGFVSSYLLFQLSLKGYGFAYLWPNQLDWNSYCISVFIALTNTFGFLLVNSFLDLKRHSQRAYSIAASLAILNAALVVITFIASYSFTIRLNSAMAFVTSIVSLGFGYTSWIQHNKYAKYYCLAWTSTFVGVVILTVSKFGVLPINFWTENSGQIGVMMMVALLSFALADRFNREKELRLQAQQSSLEHERSARKSQEELLRSKAKANSKLEQKVAERTKTLEQALDELEKANTQLHVMSCTDSLTNLSNRRHFEEQYAVAFKEAVSREEPISIILCDIDFFKSINDTFGHKAGDECLIALSKLFAKRALTEDTVVARYGGEEFIFLQTGVEIEQIKEWAQQLSQFTRDMNFHFNGQHIPITGSFGIAHIQPPSPLTPDQLINQADLALYEAKNSGRNQVKSWTGS